MQKVLVITYYWPPAGGPGVQRWLKFVKYLRDFDIEPIVYIPENPNYPITDVSLIKDVPKGLKIYSLPIKEPSRWVQLFASAKSKRISSGIIKNKNQSFLEKVLLWVRGNLFIPDARKYWVKPSVKYLTKIIDNELVSKIITTGPPHSVHLIGKQLKKNNNLKWIADFRDPWTTIGYHEKLKLSSFARKKHIQLEYEVLNQADAILVTSKATKREFSSLTKTPIHCITNGFDGRYSNETELDKKFTISHIGSLLSGRNPSNLWTVLKELVRENEVFKEFFELKLVGVISKDVFDNIKGHGLEPYIKSIDYLSHKDAVQLQRQSQVLLLVEIDSEETKEIVPGKIFEYFAAKRPILAIGPEDWEVASMISETQSGRVFNYSESSDLKEVILSWFAEYQKGTLNIESTNIDQYSRKKLTRKLSEVL